MKGFTISTPNNQLIRFEYYFVDAPLTVAAFALLLPFKGTFMHARVSGHEIWTDKIPHTEIIQENCSIYTKPGEVVIGPLKPQRNKTAGCMGIYYGQGKGLDACNIFAKVIDTDLPLLQALGEKIWMGGAMELHFKAQK